MARIPRVVLPGHPHHVTQRGNFRQDVFDDDEGRRRYLAWLLLHSRISGTKIWSYCLMTNHTHTIVVPTRLDSLARTFNQAHMRYAQYMNEKHGRTGHLWQGRFYSSVLGEEHLYRAVRYVETNPVRAGLVERAGDYAWSSARARVLGERDPVISEDCPLEAEIGDWARFLSAEDDPAWVESFRAATRSGRPAGTGEFLERVAAIVGRDMTPRPAHRPPKGKPGGGAK